MCVFGIQVSRSQTLDKSLRHDRGDTGLMGTLLCSIACLLIQRTIVEALLYEPTNLPNNMPGKRRSKKKEVDEDENCMEDDGLPLPRRSLSKRQRKIVSYHEESPKTTKKTKLTKKNILKDCNDNEIPHEHSKLSQKPKIRSDRMEQTEIKSSMIKTEEKEVKVRKTKQTTKKGKKKYNQLGDEEKLHSDACDGVCNSTVANSIDKSAKDLQEMSENVSVTCSQGLDSIIQSQDATFTVGSPSTQENASLPLEDKCLSCVTSETTLDTSTTRQKSNKKKKDTAKTYVKQWDTQNTSISQEDKHWDTQNTGVLHVKQRDTQITSVSQQDKQNTKVIQEDTDNTGTQATTLSQTDKQTANSVCLENVDTIVEKVTQKLASQQNNHLQPILERIDDIMKVMTKLSIGSKEPRQTDRHVQTIRPGRSCANEDASLPSTECSDSAVQTILKPHVDVHVQTTEKYQTDASQNKLFSVQNERDILWEKCQSQTKVIRDLQNDLYKTRNEFTKDKVTYQVALVSVLTTPSDDSQYSRIITRLSQEDLSLDELCKLVLETRTGHPSNDSLPTCSLQESDDTPITETDSQQDMDDTSQEPVKLAEVKLEPRSPQWN